jgi:hypothetical protein
MHESSIDNWVVDVDATHLQPTIMPNGRIQGQPITCKLGVLLIAFA